VAQIYMRQKRCTELQDLWDDPPNTLEPVIDRHRQDVQSMMIQYLREQEIWPLLQQHCLSMVKHAQSEVYVVGDSKSKLWELCAWRWDLWSGLLAAARGMYPEEE
jgi:N-terminal acetyltransferase B complex non-catalytic subunit